MLEVIVDQEDSQVEDDDGCQTLPVYPTACCNLLLQTQCAICATFVLQKILTKVIFEGGCTWQVITLEMFGLGVVGSREPKGDPPSAMLLCKIKNYKDKR